MTWDESDLVALKVALDATQEGRSPDEHYVVDGAARAWLDAKDNPGSFSDGYHTVDELYDHRVMLWITLCRVIGQGLAWRSWTHSDGSAIPDFFLLGLGKQQGTQMTYHLPSRHWEQTEFAETLERAPEFDGHTSADVLRRLDLIRALQADG